LPSKTSENLFEDAFANSFKYFRSLPFLMGGKEKDMIAEGLDLKVQFAKRGGQVPVVVQQSRIDGEGVLCGGDILRMEYADNAVLGITLSEGHPFLWTPEGSIVEETGLQIFEILVDCDQDALIYRCRGDYRSRGDSARLFRQLPSPSEVKYDKDGLVPVVTQELATGDVLMVAYANADALRKTIEDGFATYWSTSRKALWKKGESSGDLLRTESILLQSGGNAVAYVVEMLGSGACHTEAKDGTHRKSCFYRKIADRNRLEFLPGME